MQVKTFLEEAIRSALSPLYLEVLDESFMHNVPEGAQSHFKVTVVSDAFEGKRLLARHREVNALAAEALAGPVHALALHTYTSKEWEARGGESLTSPNCLGGSKHDA
ncbi:MULTISPECIES: BolA/IbaG family iron-sulfur metabolism protein [unclassified Alteromonas]|jgi:BolA protein|uniref:BolA/IbaG family iron-sulfur metabolism protein n=1 Tax=unclassified Alteromonas TaxID=2614992 RepID=UPI001924BFA1|nr:MULTISPECIES: BolA/IbaG family iron-sulfur metabolism protein [unclassified Alteromonas]WDT86735.1 BolA/IbaG family iron-sulfur metabolism protein [Alteromonas sp. 009811495]BCO17726.1 transcriptional regulator [Alteromonas sp. KC3]BCO21687.1 transcriptional regulator [Alteromonas sp. KC14]